VVWAFPACSVTVNSRSCYPEQGKEPALRLSKGYASTKHSRLLATVNEATRKIDVQMRALLITDYVQRNHFKASTNEIPPQRAMTSKRGH